MTQGRTSLATGERTNAWAEELQDLVSTHGSISVPDPGTEHGRELVLALGATYGGLSERVAGPGLRARPLGQHQAPAPRATFRGRPESYWRARRQGLHSWS